MLNLARLLFWSSLIFALVMASMKQPVALPGDPSAKVQHIAAFVVLSALAAWAYPRLPLVAIFLGMALFGGLIEMVQSIPTLHRDADFNDWAADAAAAGATLLIVAAIRLALRRSAPDQASDPG